MRRFMVSGSVKSLRKKKKKREKMNARSDRLYICAKWDYIDITSTQLSVFI